MNPRIESELELLRRHYGRVDHLAAGAMHWFQVHGIRVPDHWAPPEIPAAFPVTEGHPGVEPYGFFVPAELKFKGNPPSEANAPHQPPFEGAWRFLSWKPVGWRPAGDVRTGSNLWGWVRSFADRLQEGV